VTIASACAENFTPRGRGADQGDPYKTPFGDDNFEHPAARQNARFDPLPWALNKG
jgi:hypothetical protein